MSLDHTKLFVAALALLTLAGCGDSASVASSGHARASASRTSTSTATPPSPTPTNARVVGAVPTATNTPTAVGTPGAPLLPNGLAPRPGLGLLNGEALGCVPVCEAYGTAQGGYLPAGHYQTKWFFGGYMTLESDGSWPIAEDSTAELSLFVRDGGTDPLTKLTGLWLDPQLFLHGHRDTDVAMTAEAYAAWLQTHPDLIVSSPVPATIGSMPALYVDVKLGPTTVQDGGPADCGSLPCILFINNPRIPKGFEHVDGILGGDIYRFYFADVRYSGTNHLLVLKVEGSDPADLESTVARLTPLLDSATFPARPAGTATATP